MLKVRIISGLFMGGAFLVGTLLLPPVGALMVLLLLAGLGLHEYFTLLDAAKIPNFRVLGTLAGCGLVAASWVGLRGIIPAPAFEVDIFALFLAFFAVFVRQLFSRGNGRPLETMAGTLMGILYIGFCMTFFVRIIFSWGDMNGRWLLFYMIGVVKSSDIGAYLFGMRFGRHKLVERISPAKTWEGCLGGLATSVAVSLVVWYCTAGDMGPSGVRLTAPDAVVLGALLAVTGILGDLAESVLKRASGLKDSSRLIAGMGGLLDVFDSILPAAPVFYFYVRVCMGSG